MSQKFKIGLLLLGDVVVLYVSLLLTLLIRYQNLSNVSLVREHILPFSILFIIWLAVFYIYNLYDLTATKNTLEFFTAFGKVLIINFSLAVLFFYFIPFFEITPKRNLFLFLLVFSILFLIWRQGINRTLKTRLNTNTIILGSGNLVFEIANILNTNPQIGYRVVLLFTTGRLSKDIARSFNIVTKKDFQYLTQLAKHYRVSTAIVGGDILKNQDVAKGLHRMLEYGIEVIDLDTFEERLKRKVNLEKIDEFWFLRHVAKGRQITYDFFKRVIDIIVSLAFVLPAVFITTLVALAIKLEGKGPIFYYQTRIGKRGKNFKMIKFRTMRLDAEKDGVKWTVKNDRRVTIVGRILRRIHLDELPQIINVLKGQMSFVGPRAEQPEFHEILKKEIPFYENRYLIKPGLTGWAQINYAYGASVEITREKLAYDFYYLKHRSLIFDIGIILRTVELVLSRRGR